MQDEFEQEEDFEFEKSRSQIKREMTALQALGTKLTELKPEQLKEVPISEDLRKAVHDMAKMRQNEARRRHLQYIGKLMRNEDHEAIQAVLDRYDSSSKVFAQAMHEIEVWRQRLIEEGNPALSEFVESHPEVDRQQLRALIRNAQKDMAQGKNTGAAKKLFQFIKALKE